jgi:hypothetical protein
MIVSHIEIMLVILLNAFIGKVVFHSHNAFLTGFRVDDAGVIAVPHDRQGGWAEF